MSIMEESRPARRIRRSITKEFKADAVGMVIDDDRSIKSVAEGLGSAKRVWGIGFVNPGLIGVNAKD